MPHPSVRAFAAATLVLAATSGTARSHPSSFDAPHVHADLASAVADGYLPVLFRPASASPEVKRFDEEILTPRLRAMGVEGDWTLDYALVDLDGDGLQDLIVSPNAIYPDDLVIDGRAPSLPTEGGLFFMYLLEDDGSWTPVAQDDAVRVALRRDAGATSVALVREEGYVAVTIPHERAPGR